MRLHLLGLPHTITDLAHSHCAFTGKILRFPEMMVPLGYRITHYGVEGPVFPRSTRSDDGSIEHVSIMTRDEQNVLRGHDGSDKTKFFADDANTGSPLYKEFNKRLKARLRACVTQDDIVLLPLGHAHWEALEGMPYTTLEMGVGYKTLYNRTKFRVFESYAWLHWHQGKEQRNGENYEWVIPNYYNPDDWKVHLDPNPKMVVFLGRIGPDKGLPTIVEIAKRRPDLRFVICGQGDPKPYQTEPNIIYLPPIEGKTRSMLLGNAIAVLMPTNFTEPFAGVSAEAQLCGTPVISTSYGAFTETIEDEVTGFRCHTLGDFLAALKRVEGFTELDRLAISQRARRLWGYDRVGLMYDRVFQQLQDLHEEGWYSPRSVFNRARSQHDVDSEAASRGDRTQPRVTGQGGALLTAGNGDRAAG